MKRWICVRLHPPEEDDSVECAINPNKVTYIESDENSTIAKVYCSGLDEPLYVDLFDDTFDNFVRLFEVGSSYFVWKEE